MGKYARYRVAARAACATHATLVTPAACKRQSLSSTLGRVTLRALSGLLALALLLPACGAPDRAAAPGTVPVVASTDVYGAVVQAVGGDRVTVTSLISDPAVDPHSYEAPPAAAAAVARARLVVVNGGGYDEFAERLTPGPGAAVIDVVALSGLAAPAGGDLNEHVWYSLPTMKKLAGADRGRPGRGGPGGRRAVHRERRRVRGPGGRPHRAGRRAEGRARRRAHRRHRAGAPVPDRRRGPGRRDAAGVQRGRRGGRRPARRGRRQDARGVHGRPGPGPAGQRADPHAGHRPGREGRPGRGSTGRRGGGDPARRNHRLRRMDHAPARRL